MIRDGDRDVVEGLAAGKGEVVGEHQRDELARGFHHVREGGAGRQRDAAVVGGLQLQAG